MTHASVSRPHTEQHLPHPRHRGPGDEMHLTLPSGPACDTRLMSGNLSFCSEVVNSVVSVTHLWGRESEKHTEPRLPEMLVLVPQTDFPSRHCEGDWPWGMAS